MSTNNSNAQTPHKITVISGGTATNNLIPLFQSLTPSAEISFCMPVSDNGGSTSEILRVLGGPAIGDLRSRITRLITDEGFKKILSYRLSEDPIDAKQEWTLIVEGIHPIWSDLEVHSKEMVRSFLIHVHMELLKKSRNPLTNFKFEMASIGNLLLTGARLFVGSLDPAIELILRMTRVDPLFQVLPCLNTNYTYHISALLQNGEIITGQSQISHPSEVIPNHPMTDLTVSMDNLTTSHSSSNCSPRVITGSFYNSILLSENHEDVPYQHPDLLISQLKFSKDVNSPLASPISRIFYINQYGEEIHPNASTRTIKALSQSNVIWYSIGSLMTSIVPVLVLRGVGETIQANCKAKKILLLNGNQDRETTGLDASGFIRTIYNACCYSFGADSNPQLKLSEILTDLIYIEDSEIKVNLAEIQSVMGVKCTQIQKDQIGEETGINLYDPKDLLDKVQSIIEH
ncbi:hypothetical protein WICPIJ_000288 [Wickerhamomyces pijperi]|uniref:Uncharacterized protein n=1 Tax=Wickerhamomyces pijperi TaxID=599730 RepID=A0A9P8QHG6_WICPI|nr:hypothetical protein WICPIJ_000288 [Wickerhamomyces pijperi]